MKEIWRNIENYEGYYMISNKGNCKSLEKDIVITSKLGKKYIKHLNEQLLKPHITRRGYVEFELYKDKKNKFIQAHVMVAKAFIPNPNNYGVVHHIDHNPQNNKVDNLMWISKKEHQKLHHEERDANIHQYTIDGELVKIWHSINEIKKKIGFSSGAISECCNGKRKTYKGYKWYRVQ